VGIRFESGGTVLVRRDSRPWAVGAIVVTAVGAWLLDREGLGTVAVAGWVGSGLALWFLWFRVVHWELARGEVRCRRVGPFGRVRVGRSPLDRVRLRAEVGHRAGPHAPEQFTFVAEAVTAGHTVPLCAGIRESIVLRRAQDVAAHLGVPFEDAVGDEGLVREPLKATAARFGRVGPPPPGVEVLEDRVRLGASLRRESVVFEGDQVVLRVAVAGVRVAKFVIERDDVFDLRLQARSRRGMQRGLAVITSRGPRVLGMGLDPQTLGWLRGWLGWKLWPASEHGPVPEVVANDGGEARVPPSS